MKWFSTLFLSVLVLGAVPQAFAGEEVSPLQIEGATTVSVEQAKALFDDGALFVDVRKDKDWAAGRIPDALHLNLKTNFTEAGLLEEISKQEKAVFYCNGATCLRSSKASAIAVGWGFSKVYYFRDGFPAWKAASYPVE